MFVSIVVCTLSVSVVIAFLVCVTASCFIRGSVDM